MRFPHSESCDTATAVFLRGSRSGVRAGPKQLSATSRERERERGEEAIVCEKILGLDERGRPESKSPNIFLCEEQTRAGWSPLLCPLIWTGRNVDANV